MEKRDAVIIAADIVGYSRLMARNEEDTILRMQELFASVISPAITSADARVIKYLGDGILVEAKSVQQALEASIDIQKTVWERQRNLAAEDRIQYRIGVNAGEAFFTDDDVFGDVVNIAARLESLARPGEVCVTQPVRDRLEGRLRDELRPLGPQYVRNIPVPVDVWKLAARDAEVDTETSSERANPSIAVLPFDCVTANQELSFLGDGLAEELTTQLARFRSLFVIARNSAFTFRDKQDDLRAIARELNVAYLVTGRVRTSSSRVRVHIDLIDGATGAQIWADRLDRALEDIFDLQDDLVRATLSIIVPELGANERAISLKKPTQSLNAWGLCQRAMSEQFKYTSEGIENAFELLNEAIEADPKFALPRALLSRWYVSQVMTGRSQSIPQDIQKGFAFATEALQLDDRLEDSHAALGALFGLMGQDVEALKALDRAEALNSHNPYIYYTRSYVHLFQEIVDHVEMERAAENAIRVSPRDPLAWAQYFMLGTARWNYDLHNPAPGTQDALDQACSYSNCEFFVFIIAAKFHIRFGEHAVAKSYLKQAQQKRPDLTLTMWRNYFPFRAWPKMIADTEPELEILVQYGLARA